MSISTARSAIAFFQDARAFVHQRINAAIDDFFGGNLALRNAGFDRHHFDQRVDFRIGDRPAILVVFVPARAGFLAEASHLAKPIVGNG